MPLNIKYRIQPSTIIWEQRVTFGPFDSKNDIDLKSNKPGVCTYCRLLAIILRLFGKIIDVPIKLANGEIKILYLNKNSLLKWIKRHGGETVSTADQCSKAIQTICDRFVLENSQKKIKEQSATKIAAVARGFLVRNKLKQWNAAATTIQTAVRSYLKKKSTVTLQAFISSYLAERKLIRVQKFKEIQANKVKSTPSTPEKNAEIYAEYILQELVFEAEKLCYFQDNRLNSYADCYKQFTAKYGSDYFTEPFQLRERARAIQEGSQEHSKTKRVVSHFVSEATKSAAFLETQARAKEIERDKRFALIAAAKPRECALQVGYEAVTLSPNDIFRDAQPADLPNTDGIYYFGTTIHRAMAIKRKTIAFEQGFKQPHFSYSNIRPSFLGIGLRFYQDEVTSLQPQEGENQTPKKSLPCKISAKKIAFIKHFMGLQALRDYFSIVAKAFKELHQEEIYQKLGYAISPIHLGDALMTRFFLRQGYDAIFVPNLKCITIFDPKIASLTTIENTGSSCNTPRSSFEFSGKISGDYA